MEKVSDLLDLISEPAFWRELGPALHVCDPEFMNAQGARMLEPALLSSIQGLVRKEGYFQLPPLDWQVSIPKMAELIVELARRDLPVPFSFVYDEFCH